MNIFALIKRVQDVFMTPSRVLQRFFKTSSRCITWGKLVSLPPLQGIFRTFSSQLRDVFKMYHWRKKLLQKVFKTQYQDEYLQQIHLGNTSWRIYDHAINFLRVNSINLGKPSESFLRTLYVMTAFTNYYTLVTVQCQKTYLSLSKYRISEKCIS